MATRMGFEPTISGVTGQYVKPLHHRAVCRRAFPCDFPSISPANFVVKRCPANSADTSAFLRRRGWDGGAAFRGGGAAGNLPGVFGFDKVRYCAYTPQLIA